MGRQGNQAYMLGQRVSGKVEKILPYGIFVRLGEGSQAYIRRRELSWAGDIEPQKLVQKGQVIEAVITELPGPGQSMELSLKATLPDPWEVFAGEFGEGDVVEGTVKDLTSYGVFVEILPGVDGLVPLSELVQWEVKKPEDVVWQGDDVEAVITRLDRKNKKIRLSIRLRMKQLGQVADIMEFLNRRVDDDPALDSELTLSQVEPTPVPASEEPGWNETTEDYGSKDVGRIVVVDGHDEVCDPLVAWLRERGFEADAAKTLEEANEKIREHSYAVSLVDIDLPGMDGLALIRQMKAEMPETQIAVMSIPEWLEERTGEIEELGVVEILEKPLDLEKIERLLVKIGQEEPLPLWRVSLAAPRTAEPAPFQEFTATIDTGTSLVDGLRAGLKQLVESIEAEIGIVFHLNPLTYAVSILAKAGTVKLTEEAIYSLQESPVKDVICEGEPILETRVTARMEARFRKLLDLLPFESCIGVPIEVQGETQHALFLFHRNPGAFHRYRLRDALATATLLAAAIERETLRQRIQSVNRILLSGQLSAGLGHEVYNKMSGLEIQLRNLQTDCRRLGRIAPDLIDSTEFRGVGQAVESLLETAGDLSSTVELFQQLIRAEDERIFDVRDVLHSTEALLKPVALRNQVSVKIESGPGLPGVFGSAIRLQQAFLNIMLNAVQQMAAKSQNGGTLEVNFSYETKDGERPIKVRISDVGPGIHKQLWGKIFTLGFSTRPDGTGLGLFIARSLVESLGGEVSVERSVVPVGTTFVVELPTASSQGETK